MELKNKIGKKGMSLPITTIVILSISVLVLIVIIAMFVNGSNSFLTSQSLSAAWTNGCTDLRNGGCRYDAVKTITLGNYTVESIGGDKSDQATIADYCAYKMRIQNSTGGTVFGADDKDTFEDDSTFQKRCAAKCGCHTE